MPRIDVRSFRVSELRQHASEIELFAKRIADVCTAAEVAGLSEVLTSNAASLPLGLKRLRAFVPKLETSVSDAVANLHRPRFPLADAGQQKLRKGTRRRKGKK